MFASAREASRHDEEPAVDMAPLIDMVFILLIFFLVTATFTQEAGLDVVRPRARAAAPQDRDSLRVAVDRDGHPLLGGRRLTLAELETAVAAALRASPDRSVVVVADEGSSTGALVAALDRCVAAGARRVAVAATPGDGRSQ